MVVAIPEMLSGLALFGANDVILAEVRCGEKREYALASDALSDHGTKICQMTAGAAEPSPMRTHLHYYFIGVEPAMRRTRPWKMRTPWRALHSHCRADSVITRQMPDRVVKNAKS